MNRPSWLPTRPAALLSLALTLGGGGSLVPEADAQSAPDPMARRVSLRLVDASLDQALRALAQESGVRLSFSSDLLPPTVRVTIESDTLAVGDALREILRGTGLGMVMAASGHVVVIHTPYSVSAWPAAPAAEDGGLLAKPHTLDRIVVMGTPSAGAPERGLTTAVSVVQEDRVVRDRPRDLAALMRSSVPGVVAWELGAAGPIPQVGSVRGSSSFNSNHLKPYLDGVELASPYMLFAIDPYVIARLEMIGGPQGSALYGSDAISGVAHVVTSKGSINGGRANFQATTSGGIVESQFSPRSTFAQRHAFAVDGGGALASYWMGSAYSLDGAHVQGSRSSTMTALASGRVIRSVLSVEPTIRATDISFATPVNPLLVPALGNRAAPRLAQAAQDQMIRARTAGVTVTHEPSSRLRQTLIVGYDRNSGALVPQRNPAAVADALLGASEEDASRSSVRYSGGVRVPVGTAAVSTFTVGAEYSHLERERSGSREVITGEQSPLSAASSRVAIFADTVDNAGGFAEWKLAVGEAFFLTAGIRGERNSSFGERYGTAWSPMAGVAYVRRVGAVTLKTRAAYGRGIRPPAPSARREIVTRELRQIANPELAPETQEGAEAGIEMHVMRLATVSLTAFDQRARGLIQHVFPDTPMVRGTIQQQNVGAIANRGLELKADVRVGPMDAELALGTVSSRVKALSRIYTGDLRIGDRVPEVPGLSGAGSVGVELAGGRLAARFGATYLGSWVGYDWLSFYTDLIGGVETGPFGAYRTTYPSAMRFHAVVAQTVSPRIGWFMRADNLTNAQRNGRDNLAILPGRTLQLGLRASGGWR